MSGSTVGVAGLALVGLGFAGAGMLPQGSPQATSPDPVAWAAQLRYENANDPINWRYERPAGTTPGGEQVLYRYLPGPGTDRDNDGDLDRILDRTKTTLGDGPPMDRYLD